MIRKTACIAVSRAILGPVALLAVLVLPWYLFALLAALWVVLTVFLYVRLALLFSAAFDVFRKLLDDSGKV